MRVLIVEDEAKMAGLIRKGLRQEGMAADVALKGEDALWMAGSTEYDAIVLDLMLPGIDGFEVCRRLRDDGVWSPILMLTARDGVPDRVAGLDAGADDYLVKPFSYAELPADLEAVDARQHEVEQDEVVVGRPRALERSLAVGDDVDGHALAAQPVVQQVGQLRLILDDEHAHGGAA